jgi:hypothetical protein
MTPDPLSARYSDGGRKGGESEKLLQKEREEKLRNLWAIQRPVCYLALWDSSSGRLVHTHGLCKSRILLFSRRPPIWVSFPLLPVVTYSFLLSSVLPPMSLPFIKFVPCLQS